ncbi:MAG: L-dopachrome tautomerase-related protein [Pseudomonadota bacterium]
MRSARYKRGLGRAACVCLVALAACGKKAEPEADVQAVKDPPPIEVAARMALRPGALAVAANGDIFVSIELPKENEPRMARIGADGTLRPFPNADWNRPLLDGAGDKDALVSVSGVDIDPGGVVWLLDRGRGGEADGAPASGRKLVGWRTDTDSLAGVFLLDDLSEPGSDLNDLAVDAKHDAIYITDGGLKNGATPAIIVVHRREGTGRRVLINDPRLRPEDLDLRVGGRVLEEQAPEGARPVRLGVSAIAVDPAYEWAYFSSVSGEAIYRAATPDLLNHTLSTFQIGARVQLYGVKALGDGLDVAPGGVIYSADVNSRSIGRTSPDGAYTPLVTDARLLWPRGVDAAPDGRVYASVAQLHKAPAWNGGIEAGAPPYYILRFDPPPLPPIETQTALRGGVAEGVGGASDDRPPAP